MQTLKSRIYVGNREGLHVYDGRKTRLVTVGASRVEGMTPTEYMKKQNVKL